MNRYFQEEQAEVTLDSLKEQMDELLRLEQLNYHNIHALNSNVEQYRQSTSKPSKKGFG